MKWSGIAVSKAAAAAAYMAVNMLFLLKYGGRIGSGCAFALSIGYIMLFCVVYYRLTESVKLSRWMIAGCVAALTLLLGIQLVIDPYSIQVDRWSAIHNFLSYLLQGKYPYSAHTHLGGYASPFPVWQLFHLPFYFMGNVGLSLFVCLGVYLHSLCKWQGKRVMASACLLLLLSPALWYESAVRSDLIANFLLLAALIQYCIYYNLSLKNHFIPLSVGCGLLLSTRLSVSVPLFIFFFGSYIQLKWSKKLCFLMLVLSVFCITFLPFLFWSSQLLSFEYNPFVLQTRQGHTVDIVALTGLLIIASWTAQCSVRRYFLSTGAMLIMMVAVVFVHNMLLRGDFTALFSSVYDITYFNMSLPFLITFLALPERRETSVETCVSTRGF